MYNHTITLYNGWIPLSDLESLEDYTIIERIPIPKEQSNQKLDIDDLIAIAREEKKCFVQMLKLFAKEDNLQKVELETDIRESTLKQFIAKNSELREKWKCNIQQRFPIKKIPETLLFTHKLDTCCQAMCQEHKTAKNPAFCQRRILNRLDSVTACTAGVNSKPEANAEPDAVVSILLTGNIEDISFLYDFPCESGITLQDKEKCIMYLCFERPSEISFVCTEKNINEKYLHILKDYQEKIIERINKRQTSEIIYAIETMENE